MTFVIVLLAIIAVTGAASAYAAWKLLLSDILRILGRLDKLESGRDQLELHIKEREERLNTRIDNAGARLRRLQEKVSPKVVILRNSVEPVAPQTEPRSGTVFEQILADDDEFDVQPKT